MSYFPPTKKSYTLNSIAKWGDLLATPPNDKWENFFKKEDVEKGRDIYVKKGHISEIFIDEKEIFISFFITRTDFLYITLDISSLGKIHWRTSFKEKSEASPYAVASIYYLEEIIAEHYSNLLIKPEEKNKLQKIDPGVTNSPSTPITQKKERKTRELFLFFKGYSQKLSLFAYWEGDQPEVKNSIFKNIPTSKTTLEERSKLIRLISFCKKSGFKFIESKGIYELNNISICSYFSSITLPQWEKYFKINPDCDIKYFRKGSHELDAQINLQHRSEKSFSLDWELSAFGDYLSPDEKQLLLNHYEDKIFIKNKGIFSISKNAQKTIDEFSSDSQKEFPIYSILSLFKETSGLSIKLDNQLIKWQKQLLSEPKLEQDLPKYLRPYQKQGVVWLNHLLALNINPLLADEMGLGKTIQVLSCIFSDKAKKLPALIVCPASVVPVWENEITKFFPSKKTQILSKSNLKEKSDADIILTSYGLLWRNANEIKNKVFSYAVLDEAQFIKNPSAKTTNVCYEINAQKKLALTGTPIENKTLDLWSIFKFLMPELLGKQSTLEKELLQTPEETLNRIKTQISPFVLRRLKKDVVKELPEKTFIPIYCDLSQKQRELYIAIVEKGLSDFKKEKITSTKEAIKTNPTNILTLLMRLRQASCDASLLPGQQNLKNESGKISTLLDHLENIINSGGKVVLFSQFVSFLTRIQTAIEARFPKIPLYTLTGKTIDRNTPVQKFQNSKTAAFFLASLKAGGTGVTLHNAEHVFLLDPWWNPAVEEQAVDRVHRIGQTKPVFIYKLISSDTIEEKIELLKTKKRDLFNHIFQSIPNMSDWSDFYPSLESLISLSQNEDNMP